VVAQRTVAERGGEGIAVMPVDGGSAIPELGFGVVGGILVISSRRL
jgi:hypothetical protein